MTLVRSAGDGLPLDRWLSESVWPREALLTDEDVYWGMALGAAELLCNGITTTCEQYRHPGARRRGARRLGHPRRVHPGHLRRAEGTGPRNTWEALLERGVPPASTPWTGREGRLHLGFGPHAAYTVPPEGLRAIAARRSGATRCSRSTSSETEAEGDDGARSATA